MLLIRDESASCDDCQRKTRVKKREISLSLTSSAPFCVLQGEFNSKSALDWCFNCYARSCKIFNFPLLPSLRIISWSLLGWKSFNWEQEVLAWQSIILNRRGMELSGNDTHACWIAVHKGVLNQNKSDIWKSFWNLISCPGGHERALNGSLSHLES